MSGLAGLGSFLGGLADGARRNDALLERDAALNAQKALSADRAAAKQAADDWLRTQTTQTQPSAAGGLDESQGGLPLAAQQPTEQQKLKAASIYGGEMMRRGRYDEAAKVMGMVEPIRARHRAESARAGMLDWKTTGNPTNLLRSIYDQIDDGWDLDGDVTGYGDKQFVVKRRNTITGKTDEQTYDADQINDLVMEIVASPEDIAKYSFREKLEAFKGDQDRKTNAERHRNTLEEIDRRNEGAYANTVQRGLDQRDVARIRVSGTITAAQIRKAAGGGLGGTGNNVARTVDNADGTRTLIFRNGDAKTLVGDDGKPLMGAHAEKALQGLTTQVGKTIEGSLATPEANRERARKMLPQPPSGPKQVNRIRLDAQGNVIQ